MSKFLTGTRFLIIIPIIGLTLAAATFFIYGGYGLLRLLFDLVSGALSSLPETASTASSGSGLIIFEVVEYVHTFLVGTVLYITAIGLYQLFINEINFVGWLKIDSIEELETNLIGVTVVVLAVNFMGAVFTGQEKNLLQFGAGIALPIAALGLFIGLRTWSLKVNKDISSASESNKQH